MSRRATTLLLVLLGVTAAACSSTPPPDPLLPSVVVVTSIDDRQLMGGRAVYGVDAPFDLVKGLILDFNSQPEFRPMVLEAELMSRTETEGEVRFVFEGLMGINPTAHCLYKVEEEDGITHISYEMVNRSMVLQALKGGFRLQAADGGNRTLVTQEFLVSALMVDREDLLEELRIDAEAVKARAEAMAKE